MARALTAAGIARYKPGKERREIRDGAATGLYLILQESGQRSFALRFRKPNGKPAKLTLGPVDVSGVEQAGTPVLGAPLTLAGARALASRSPLLRQTNFVPQAQTPRNCCVRFVAGVTVGSRNTCYRASRYGLTRTGLAPVGLHQLSLAPSESWVSRFPLATCARSEALSYRRPLHTASLVEFSGVWVTGSMPSPWRARTFARRSC